MEYMSQNTDQIFTALAKAQGQMTVAVMNKVNPHFKSRFADLQSYFDACRGPFSANGLAVFQIIEYSEGKAFVITTLGHASGQWIRSRMLVNPTKNDMQGFGSALSYAKRYSLGAISGLASGEEDDDATEAVGEKKEYRSQPQQMSKPPIKTIDLEAKISGDQLASLTNLMAPCHPEFISDVIENLRKKYGVDKFEDIPVKAYANLAKLVMENAESAKKGEPYKKEKKNDSK